MIRIFSPVIPVVFSMLISSTANADIRIWRTTANTDGDLSGRAGADAFCDGDTNKPVVAGSTTRAFISIDATDEVQDMPTNYSVPVAEPISRQDGGLQIAANFPALLDANTTPLTNSINGIAGVAGAAFTGTTATGALDANNCSGWTTTAGNGQSGLGNSTGGGYLATGVTSCSNATSIGLFCITFTTAAPVSGNSELVEW